MRGEKRYAVKTDVTNEASSLLEHKFVPGRFLRCKPYEYWRKLGSREHKVWNTHGGRLFIFTSCWTKLNEAVIIAWDAMICFDFSVQTLWRIVKVTYGRENGENEDNPINKFDMTFSLYYDLSKLTSIVHRQ